MGTASGTQHHPQFDHAAGCRAALAANESIQAEARSVYGDHLTDDECLDRVIAVRWPRLPEQQAYEAAGRHYDIALPALPAELMTEGNLTAERA